MTLFNERLMTALVGPYLTLSQAADKDPMFAQYDKDFQTWEPKHWKADGPNWEKANYYDRAYIYYTMFMRTQKVTYLNRAKAIAQNYLNKYVVPNRYGLPFHWHNPKGIAALYAHTGSKGALKAIGAMADQCANPWNTEGNFKNLFDPAQSEGREQARVLEALVMAVACGAKSVGVPNIQPNGEDWGVAGGNNFGTIARNLVERAISSTWQKPSGARPNFVDGKVGTAGIDKPFMNGLFNHALIQYYELVEQDQRIIKFIEQNLIFMMKNEWVPAKKAFQYIDKKPTSGGSGDGPDPAPDLNMLIVTGFGFVHSHTGMEYFKACGDEIFQGALDGAYIEGSKQFNQQYAYSARYPWDTTWQKLT